MDITVINRLKAGETGRLRVAPSTVVRWIGEAIMVSTVESRKGVSTKDARILQVLHAFAAPRLPREALAGLEYFGQAFLFISVAALMQLGVLIEEKDKLVGEPDDKSVSPCGERDGAKRDEVLAVAASRMAQEHTQAIARLVGTVASDLGGFGAYAHRADGAEGEASLVSRLSGIRAALSDIVSELHEKRAGYLVEQMSLLDLSGGLKVNLGSGPQRIEGWINVDVPPADLASHLGWGLPFGAESVSYVYLSHVLEHLYRDEALELLRDAHRVLVPAGVLRVVVPDIEKCIRAYTEKNEGYFETRRRLWARSIGSAETPLELVLRNAGAGVKPGQFWGHKQGYDFETLSHVLSKAGFSQVERSDYMRSAHDALRIDTAGRTTAFAHENEYFSMFVEATK